MGFTWLLHHAHLLGGSAAHRRFQRALEDPEAAQRRRLAAILGALRQTAAWCHLPAGLGYETFREVVPIRTYAELEPELEAQRQDGAPRLSPRCRRWQPTSGSTARRKWIPYPPGFLAELDQAAGAWMGDLHHLAPRAFAGRHYWSLSWMPDALRGEGVDPDDLSLLPAWKRGLLGRVMAVPPSVGRLTTSAESWQATVAWLAAREDLALLSLWSPTFGLALLQTLADHREALAEGLRSGCWPWGPGPRSPRAARQLREWSGRLDSPFFQALWPRLALVSAWDDGASSAHAARLRTFLPQARFQGKGLWATEGVVSFPFREARPLAVTSHVLELRCLATGRVHPAWDLEVGQEVQPLLSTSAGLLRYPLEDRLVVDGRLGRTPTVRFLGRIGGTDLVGEKLDEGAVGRLLHQLEARWGLRCLTLFAVTGEPCRYVLLAEGLGEVQPLEEALEAGLGAFHHYRLARELGQLGIAEVYRVAEAAPILARLAEVQGQAAGEAKGRHLATWPVEALGPRLNVEELQRPSGQKTPPKAADE